MKMALKQLTKNRVMLAAFCLAGLTVGQASAQGPTFDTSGNGLLSGVHFFRRVVYYLGDNAGDLQQAQAFYGAINFDGNGHYTISGAQLFDSNNSGVVSFSQTGTYSVAASGYGFMSAFVTGENPMYFTVSNGVVIGSTTEGINLTDRRNDVYISSPPPSPLPVNSTFSGSYQMAGFIPGGQPGNASDVFFPMNADGNGNVSNVNVTGYFGSQGTAIVTQPAGNLKYRFSNGTAVVTFPNNSNSFFFAGDEYLNFSADGKFVFGGSPNFFDMVIGVKNDASSVVENFSGLYYQGGIDQDVSQLATAGFANLDTYYGTFSANGGSLLGTQRLNSLFNNNAITTTFADTFPTTLTGGTPVSDAFTQYAFSNQGSIRIGAGIWPFLGLTVGVRAPSLSASGVFLNPMGITNAASSSSFVGGISNGEMLTLYGSNMANTTTVATSLPLPGTLSGTQVLINGSPAPLVFVSPNQVSVLVPYGNTFPVAQIQINNNGTLSNVVTEFVHETSVGAFTVPPGGLGDGAILHNSDGSLVTTANPAQPGEFVQVFLTGLGNVFPTVGDGVAAPSNPLSSSIYFNADPTQTQITAFIGGAAATITYAGLAPTLAGLYQINLQIPTGLTAGTNTLDVGGPDSYAAQTVIPIGTGSVPTSATVPSASAARARQPMSLKAAPAKDLKFPQLRSGSGSSLQ
jgi:uncharacterized protein (TIGR03437 family)